MVTSHIKKIIRRLKERENIFLTSTKSKRGERDKRRKFTTEKHFPLCFFSFSLIASSIYSFDHIPHDYNGSTLSNKVCSSLTLNPNISMHILHTVLYTFPKVLTRTICFNNGELLWLAIISSIIVTLSVIPG